MAKATRLRRGVIVAALVLVACAPTNVAPRTPPAGTSTPSPASWIHADYHGDRLVVALAYPGDWRSQLQPLSLHYTTIFGFLSNFSLPPYCQRTPESISCSWSSLSTFPPGGMLVSFGTQGAGPLPLSVEEDQLFAQGTPISVDGKRAVQQAGQGPASTPGFCPQGADHWLAYWIVGSPAAIFNIHFCWRGVDPSLAEDAQTVATHLTLRPDPSNQGPFPS